MCPPRTAILSSRPFPMVGLQQCLKRWKNVVSWCGISVAHSQRTRSVSASVLMPKWRRVYRRCANRSPRGRSGRSQEGEHRVVYAPVRDNGIATINRWRASEITKTTARFLDQDLERRHVPGFYTRLKHDLGLATTHKCIGEI